MFVFLYYMCSLIIQCLHIVEENTNKTNLKKQKKTNRIMLQLNNSVECHLLLNTSRKAMFIIYLCFVKGRRGYG